MNVAQLITALEKLPLDAEVEAYNGFEDDTTPVTCARLCSDGTVFISCLTEEQDAD